MIGEDLFEEFLFERHASEFPSQRSGTHYETEAMCIGILPGDSEGSPPSEGIPRPCRNQS